MCILEIIIFATFEKLLKEYWVIRNTNEKSFRTFMNMVTNHSDSIFIVNESLGLVYINNKFEEVMRNLIRSKYPSQLNEFIHENSYETFASKITEVIKTQESITETVNIIKNKIVEEDAGVTQDSNATTMSFGMLFYNFSPVFDF